MGYLKRAVDLAAVTELDFVFGLGHVLVVAALTEIMRPVAEVDGHAAAEQALPLDVLRPVLVAHGVTDTVGFKLAVLAHEVLSYGLLLDVHVSSTINHSSEVGLRTRLTLIKAARVDRQPENVFIEWTSC